MNTLTTPANALAWQDLCGGYGDTQVLRPLSGEVQPGQVLAVLGRNGVGKSTLLKLLSGALPQLGGQVWLHGQPLGESPAHRRYRAGMVYLPQERVVFDSLSVKDNLCLHQSRGDLAAYEPMFEQFPRLKERLRVPAGLLSGGEKKLVAFARCLTSPAQVVLLDEPSEGVQEENIQRMSALIQAQCQDGKAFVLVEQNLSFAAPLLHQVIVLDHGDVVLSGNQASASRAEIMRHLTV